MKLNKILLILSLLTSFSLPTLSQAGNLNQDVQSLQQEWERIKYRMTDKNAQLHALISLEKTATEVVNANPSQPEAMIWKGIILSTEAGILNNLSALGKVKQAKLLFEQSIRLKPFALNGSAQASLGVLYSQVPGWPMAFGNMNRAEQYLKQALTIDPTGIDSNYFYGEFLLRTGRYQDAVDYLKKAMQAPNRPDRPLADAGRRQEIKQALVKAEQALAN